MMAKYRMVRTDFWFNPIVLEEMTPEDRYFYLYLLTNPQTTQIGIYKITKKRMAFDLGYSIETVHSLMERFIEHHKLIRYNPETRELAIKYWGKDNLHKAGKPVMDCIFSELKEVEDSTLIYYVLESIQREEIRSLFESFCKQDEMTFVNEVSDPDENDTYIDKEYEAIDDTFTHCYTIGGQKEKEKENKKEKQKQKALHLTPHTANNQKTDDVKEKKEHLNRFGYSCKMDP
ncbi:DNA replication protein DnaD [Neobacillus rhizophilus]|uniref:DNA replication protein DnaD n=1 Tax=Neobacillus rhizophilus TaxID=2833579 RepID=UPI002017DB4C|nr:DNA replication protein DnaD [Neobacillus rhizophilus]